jgi:hypothetical protein
MTTASATYTVIPTVPLPEVWVTREDGTETKVFDYYPDELSFAAADFVGLTVEECRLLKFGRDRAFLQS